jgi:uncharacterized protein YndB with AHSA1/START domain
MDVRVGGRWRWAAKAFGGYEFAFYGEYLEVVPGERLVTTETFSGAPEAGAVNTTTFTEKDGRTHLEILVEHRTEANRNKQLQSGMEDGLQDALTLLEELVREPA